MKRTKPLNTCPTCGNEVDPEICWCGNFLQDHGFGREEHGFVPMGCTCGFPKEKKLNSMKYLDRQMLAAGVAERWKRQHKSPCVGCCKDRYDFNDCNKCGTPTEGWKVEDYGKYVMLKELGPTPKIEDINRIIGNDAWTILACDNCNKEATELCSLGEPRAGADRQYFCIKCLQQAVSIFKSHCWFNSPKDVTPDRLLWDLPLGGNNV